MNLDRTNLKRREFCLLVGVGALSIALACCSRVSGFGFPYGGRLSARPRSDVKTSVTGQIMHGVDSRRDAVLQVPKNVASSPLPLLIMMHGATQSSDTMTWC